MDFNELTINVPDLKKLEKFYSKILTQMKEASDAKTVTSLMKKLNKFNEGLETDITVISIKFSIDTTNEEYKVANDKVSEIMPVVSSYIVPIEKEILAKPFRKELEDIWGDFLFKKYENDVSGFDEKIIPFMIEESKLSNEYDAILGGAQIEFKGQIYNLSQLGKFTQSLDREERYEASKKMEKFFKDNEKAIGDIYDKLVHIRHKMALTLGYSNYVDYGYKRLGRVDYNSTMVKGYRDQIYKAVVPVCKKLIKKQAKRIGIAKPMFYDLNLEFKSGNAKPQGSAEYLVEQAQVMYNDMSKETGEFFKLMNDSHLLSLIATPGKRPGGYMTYLPAYKVPFIFSNFNGTSGDVDVLTHEFGHAFQGYTSRNIPVPEYHMPTLEACEIHSMSMEFLTYPWMELFFKEDTNKYKFAHLEDAIEFLPYGVAIDEFQHFVYENPDVTHDERCAKWREIEKKYLPLKKYNGFSFFNKGTWWMKQSHIFGSPFYYIDYTLAQVCAFQFFNESLKNKDKTWKKYLKLCKMGGKYPFLTLLEKAHLRNPFIDGNVKKAIRPLVKYLDQFDDQNM